MVVPVSAANPSRRRSTHRTTSATLLALCRGQADVAGVVGDDTDRDDLVRAVRHHRVAPLAHVRLRDIDGDLSAALLEDRDRAIAVHLGATAVLDSLGLALGDVPWLAFKGPVLSEHAHPLPGLRTYHDIDVLVDPLDLREVAARLAAAGWQLMDHEHMLRIARTPGEMHWMSPVGLQLDLHWSMINMESRRQRYSVPTADLLGRRRRQVVAFGHAWTLDAVDAMVHVCLHAALTGAHRMLLLLDADQLARQVEDWSAVAARAREWQAQAAVALVLHRSARLLGTPLPDDLDRLLRISPAFLAVTGTVDRLVPVSSLRTDASVPRLVSRAARPGAGSTLVSIGRSSALGVRDRLRRPGPEAVRVPASKEALDQFLGRVEAEARR